jgi:SPP1 family predicted phage head-tail adaptor
VKAPRLDRRVTIQSRALAPDAQGQQIETWSEVATVWASKRDLRGREYYAANTTNAEVSTTFEIRYRADVTVLNRLVCEGITYDIQQVSEIGRRVGLQLICSAKVP